MESRCRGSSCWWASPLGTLACRRRYPYLLVGWLWYLGMLVPVIGLVQVGSQAMADRYTYLPQIGLCIALAWGAADVCRLGRIVAGRAASGRRGAGGAHGRCMASDTFWQDSGTLWTHALACTSPNNMAHNNLGNALASLGRFDEAMAHYRAGVENQA